MLDKMYDYAQYNVRLNLTIPDHLTVHRILKHLNKTYYKSQNAFIIEVILEKYYNHSDDEILEEDEVKRRNKDKFITKAEFEECKNELKTEVLREMTALVIASISRGNISAAPVANSGESSDDKEDTSDEMLVNLANQWA